MAARMHCRPGIQQATGGNCAPPACTTLICCCSIFRRFSACIPCFAFCPELCVFAERLLTLLQCLLFQLRVTKAGRGLHMRGHTSCCPIAPRPPSWNGRACMPMLALRQCCAAAALRPTCNCRPALLALRQGWGRWTHRREHMLSEGGGERRRVVPTGRALFAAPRLGCNPSTACGGQQTRQEDLWRDVRQHSSS